MGILNKILYKSLSQHNYLKVLNSSFLALYNAGLLKNNASYRYHYFAKNLVKPGDTVADLGANLGYYANLFQQWVGPGGKLYCVEPVIPFNEILQWRLGDKKNVTIYPFALGTEEKNITLIIPKDLAYLSTGLPHVYNAEEHGSLQDYGFQFEARMKKGSELLKDLDRLDFVKCDIEGYEEFVLPEMKPVFEKHKPIVQVETWGTHKAVVEAFFKLLGYDQYYLDNGELKNTGAGHPETVVDFIFVHPANQAALHKILPFKSA